MSPLDRRQQRWTQLHALALEQGTTFAAIANGLIDPECGALPLAEAIPQLEAMLTNVGMALPTPEPEPVQPVASPTRLGNLLPPTAAEGSNTKEYERLAARLQPAYREAIERLTQDPAERAAKARECLEQPAPTTEPAHRPNPVKAVSHKRAAPPRTGQHPRRHTRERGKRSLSAEIYANDFYAVPRSVPTAVLVSMPRSVLLGWFACCDTADSNGVFHMSRLTMAKATGHKAVKTGDRIIRLLLGAGLIELVNSGGHGIATIYSLAPRGTIDPAKAVAWFEGQATAERFRLREDFPRKEGEG